MQICLYTTFNNSNYKNNKNAQVKKNNFSTFKGISKSPIDKASKEFLNEFFELRPQIKNNTFTLAKCAGRKASEENIKEMEILVKTKIELCKKFQDLLLNKPKYVDENEQVLQSCIKTDIYNLKLLLLQKEYENYSSKIKTMIISLTNFII